MRIIEFLKRLARKKVVKSNINKKCSYATTVLPIKLNSNYDEKFPTRCNF